MSIRYYNIDIYILPKEMKKSIMGPPKCVAVIKYWHAQPDASLLL